MQGALAHRNGVLYVGRHAKTAWVRAFDLGGRPLETSFSLRDEVVGRSSVEALAIDEDHRLWLADGAAGKLRAFTLFGREVACVEDEPLTDGEREDSRGRIGTPSGLAVDGSDDELVVAVASRGRRRHALQLLHPDSGRTRSVRPRGNPRGEFHGLRGVALAGDWLYACETGTGRVHVFRDGEHHFEFACEAADGRESVPVAVDVLPDRRAVVAMAGDASALLLVDPAGRVMRVLAREPLGPGDLEEGSIEQPGDVVVAPGADDGETRVAAIDRDGERVQVFSLEGRCYGAFLGLDPTSEDPAPRDSRGSEPGA